MAGYKKGDAIPIDLLRFGDVCDRLMLIKMKNGKEMKDHITGGTGETITGLATHYNIDEIDKVILIDKTGW
jgi:hypothetical protein